ncbi:MAG TPA: hypothetical protein VGL75_02605 [Acidothermaceae bacterium]
MASGVLVTMSLRAPGPAAAVLVGGAAGAVLAGTRSLGTRLPVTFRPHPAWVQTPSQVTRFGELVASTV